MPKFIAHYKRYHLHARFQVTTETPEQALELALAKYHEDFFNLNFVPYDIQYIRYSALKEIVILADDSEPTDVTWESDDYRLHKAASDLVAALDQIEGQAVCVNMDGDQGNERMLKHIAEIARAARARASGAA